MRTPLAAALLYAGLALLCGAVRAQSLDGTMLTVAIGAIQNLDASSAQPRLGAYAEIELFTVFHQSQEAGVTFGGGLYVAGWSDGGEPAKSCRDCVIYSHTSAIAGLRAAARLDHFPLPLSFWGGASRHFTWADYAEGSDGYSQDAERDRRYANYALESGARLEIPLTSRVRMSPRVHVYVPLLMQGDSPRPVRLVWTAGVSHVL